MTSSSAALIAIAFVSGLAASPPAVSAGAIDVGASSIAHTARLNAPGTALQLRGIVRCDACKSFTLGATVSQAESGSVAQGGVRCLCHGTSERWELTARVREATSFRAGTARVCVWITARDSSGTAVDARQWCKPIRLLGGAPG